MSIAARLVAAVARFLGRMLAHIDAGKVVLGELVDVLDDRFMQRALVALER